MTKEQQEQAVENLEGAIAWLDDVTKKLHYAAVNLRELRGLIRGDDDVEEEPE